MADRHALYEQSVQCVEAEIDFVDATFEAMRGRRARLLREDFCGTANTSCEWVRRRADNAAIGVDLDNEVLEWGRNHHVAALKNGAEQRIELRNENVLSVDTPPVDAVLAMNFSYWIFKTRALLRDYFRSVRASLVEDGVFFLDCFGGYEAGRQVKEATEYDDFTYVWEQAHYNAANGDYSCHIHFRFPDGSRIKPAFSYHWRLWSLPEIRELLEEAGFSRSTVYTQGWDDDLDEEDGEFNASEEIDADAGWIVYITAEP
ncbi:MAG: class I SAM-dependent methyltransferase [Gammaproteobacteria bacterium]|nr:class I SAM-dependent methyltransferase [Gammaproteobacteria bacterium]NNM00863.1 class I SAM-dependent methyltransferase [Gammaproteobacteria bacterium]